MLKKTLYVAYFKIFTITLAVVYCVGILFYSLAPSFKGKNTQPPLFAVFDGGKIILKSENLSSADANDIKLTELSGKELYIINDVSYIIKKSMTDSGAECLTLVPSGDLTKEITLFLWVLLTTFAVSFYLCLVYYRRKLSNEAFEPLSKLGGDLKRIADGDLEESVKTEGESETAELFENLEKLRIKLKDAIFYQKQIDENRSFLVSSISHDLKTPVTAIKGYLEGIIDGVASTSEKRSEYIEKALKKTDLITVMIDDLLYFSKLDLNQIPFNLKKVSIQHFLEYAAADNAENFKKSGKTVRFENSLKNECFVLIDEEKFQRVTQNIIDNALKYTKDDGRLDILLSENSASVLIEFKDNGEGIEKEELLHIFDKFYRADSARKIEGSSGLGLAIAKEITEGLGGRIWAISQKGSGTSVIISLKKV